MNNLRQLIADAPRLVALAVDLGWCSAPVFTPPFETWEFNGFRRTGKLSIRRQAYADAAEDSHQNL